ncbi:MAG: HD domain-containing protein, partial [Planctomycetales bacterium]|nr:HD domain-containing protein [Planctomycetales bacterium]
VGRRAMEVMLEQTPDLLLLDIKATDLRGLELLLLKRSVEALEHIPTLVMADAGRTPIKQQALRLGAADILSKPLDMVELVPRVRNVVVAAQREDQLAQERAQLEELVHRRTYELEHSRQQLILSLARAAEHRDNETGNHVIRGGRFAGIIARELGWSQERAVMLEQAAQLHDVGKIGVPDDILFKPGKLDPDEYDLIKRHCAWGKDIIEPYSSREFQMLKSHARLGEAILHVRTSPMLMMASRIAQTHHENWDGTGYPLGLAGEDIPIEGRITAVADVFDALSSKRPYKDPFPREKCFAILREQRGTKFDPDVLDAFFRRADEVVAIQLDLMEDDL